MRRAGILAAVLLTVCVLVGYVTEISASQQLPKASAVPPPDVIYVADFCLDASQIKETKPLGIERPGILGNRLQLLRDKNPEIERQKLIAALSDSIVKHLRSKKLTAEYLSNVHPDCSLEAAGLIKFTPSSAPLPKDGWLLLGWFEKVQEGQAAVEAAVGFGTGGGKAEASVAVVDLADNPRHPFLLLGSDSVARMMPGGGVAINPYVIGAKFVIERKEGMEKDVKNLGAAIAKSLVQYIEQGPQSQ